MGEYTLVFRRALASDGRASHDLARAWVVTRPAPAIADGDVPPCAGRATLPSALAQLFAVPICSALGMESSAYERFLFASGVLDEALAVLGAAPLTRPVAATTARKEIQSLVMAAEVQHIVGRLSA